MKDRRLGRWPGESEPPTDLFLPRRETGLPAEPVPDAVAKACEFEGGASFYSLAASETSGDTALSDQRSGLSLTQTMRSVCAAADARNSWRGS